MKGIIRRWYYRNFVDLPIAYMPYRDLAILAVMGVTLLSARFFVNNPFITLPIALVEALIWVRITSNDWDDIGGEKRMRMQANTIRVL